MQEIATEVIELLDNPTYRQERRESSLGWCRKNTWRRAAIAFDKEITQVISNEFYGDNFRKNGN